MPIYEYECKNCSHQFEQLVLTSNDPAPECPKCQGGKVEKLISAASIRAHGIPKGSGGFSDPGCKPSGG